MGRSGAEDIDRLRRDIDRALADKLDADGVLPLLARLARATSPRSEPWLYAHRHLAEMGVEHDPWRAAPSRAACCSSTRRTTAPGRCSAWRSRCSATTATPRAPTSALAIAPENPWYAHNLGHLYDVALNRPHDALPLLAQATEAQTGEADIAASYAHALARCGKLVLAKKILKRAIRHGATADQMALWRWLDAGAPTTGESGPDPQRLADSKRKAKRRRARERQSLGD